MARTTKRVYRAIAHYEGYVVRRHFFTKRARDNWATNRRNGFPEEEGPYIGNGEYDDRPALEPALSVYTDESDPIIFPVDNLVVLASVERCFETPGVHAEGCKP
jgi:hypothetical protein